MKRLIITVLLLLLTSCGGSTTSPTEIADVRTALEFQINVLALGIEREDSILASQAISEKFRMGSNVAVRYDEGGWSGSGIGKFREFFDDAFEIHSNIDQGLTILDIYLTGNVATARVHNEFLSSRVDWTPPDSFSAEGWDWMIFERDSGQWLLISWEEAPEPVEEEG